MSKQIVNINDLELQEFGKGERFKAHFGRISPMVGAKSLGYNLTVVPAGKTAFPYHNHNILEEMFFVIEGRGEVRLGNDRFPIKAGDVIACPAGGPETAHQIINNSDKTLKYLAVSNEVLSDVCEYPDSGKIGLYSKPNTGENGAERMFRYLIKGDHITDYWDGEAESE